MKKIINFYWMIFFSVYWVAKNLNKKNDPPWSACVIMSLILFNVFCGMIFFISSLDSEKRPIYKGLIVLAGVSSFVINETVKSKHKKWIKSYDYLSKPKAKKLRFMIAFGALLTGLLVMTIGAFSMNEIVHIFFRELFM